MARSKKSPLQTSIGVPPKEVLEEISFQAKKLADDTKGLRETIDDLKVQIGWLTKNLFRNDQTTKGDSSFVPEGNSLQTEVNPTIVQTPPSPLPPEEDQNVQQTSQPMAIHQPCAQGQTPLVFVGKEGYTEPPKCDHKKSEALMPLSSFDENAACDSVRQTLAETLFFFSTPESRRELEEFRIYYEQTYGETDLTKTYTSMWAPEKQDWLLENHPKRYWDGLPPFVQSFIKRKMRAAQNMGKLDDMPDSLLSLYATGQMNSEDEIGD